MERILVVYDEEGLGTAADKEDKKRLKMDCMEA
jgi:hypothetical protein